MTCIHLLKKTNMKRPKIHRPGPEPKLNQPLGFGMALFRFGPAQPDGPIIGGSSMGPPNPFDFGSAGRIYSPNSDPKAM